MTPPSVDWPNVYAYSEYIQYTDLFFADRDLKAATIGLDKDGLPAVVSGAHALVFKATVGSADLAIRCFTMSVPSVQERYRKLSQHLRSSNGRQSPDYLVDFDYRDRGVMVDGIHYPLLRMNWAHGSFLRKWIAENRKNARRLRALASRWREVMHDLHSRGIAHGDLASDNCLVRNESDFTLVDYDGCYINTLKHANPGEYGHADYQHPKRKGYYGPNMDAFPALVIYLSLIALAADPALWESHNDSDVNLIFTDKDYLNPDGTPIWSRLKRSTDPEVKELTKVLAGMCHEPIDRLSPLSEVLEQVNGAPGPQDWRIDWMDDPLMGIDSLLTSRPVAENPDIVPAGHRLQADPMTPPAPAAKRRKFFSRLFRRRSGSPV